MRRIIAESLTDILHSDALLHFKHTAEEYQEGSEGEKKVEKATQPPDMRQDAHTIAGQEERDENQKARRHQPRRADAVLPLNKGHQAILLRLDENAHEGDEQHDILKDHDDREHHDDAAEKQLGIVVLIGNAPMAVCDVPDESDTLFMPEERHKHQFDNEKRNRKQQDEHAGGILRAWLAEGTEIEEGHRNDSRHSQLGEQLHDKPLAVAADARIEAGAGKNGHAGKQLK